MCVCARVRVCARACSCVRGCVRMENLDSEVSGTTSRGKRKPRLVCP